MEKRGIILLLENEENDVFFFRRALSACRYDGNVRVVETVRQAREYLEGNGEYRDRSYYPLPDLIVTDFKMPALNGVEFLRWLLKHRAYTEIPVVMFSGSTLAQDRAAALDNGALAYFSKSGDFHQMCERVTAILKYMGRQET